MRRQPFTRRGVSATKKRENVTFAKRDGKWRCTGSRCLPAPADPLPEPALHYFSAGGAPILRKPASFALSLAGTSALFSTISDIIIVGICHCRGCVSFSRGCASLPSLLVLASTCGHGDLGQGSHQSRPAASKTSRTRERVHLLVCERRPSGSVSLLRLPDKPRLPK